MFLSTQNPVLKITFLILPIFLVLLFSGPVHSQLLPTGQTEKTETNKPEFPKDSLGRRTPRGTVNGFVKAVADQDYIKASRYLNLPEDIEGNAERIRIVKIFQRLLDGQGYLLPYSRISDEPEGRTDDNLLPEVDRVGTLTADGESTGLFVEETTGAQGGPVWLFSKETIITLTAVNIEDILLVERIIPDFLEKITWGNVSAGQWLLMLTLIGISYLIAFGVVWLVVFLIKLVWKKARTESTGGIINAFLLPIRLYLAVWCFVILTKEVGISILVRQRLNETVIMIGVFALLLLFWRLNDFLTDMSQKRMIQRGQPSGLSVVLFLRRLAKVVIFVVGFIVVLSAIGVDVTAGLAALGIGGLALALGAQKSIENFVGSVTLIADRPLRVGDFCKINDTVGTVENIGMRSTRIRTLDRTLVTIPNGELSSGRIENYAHRDRFRLYTVFGMRYETSPDQIRFLLMELRKILYSHPKVDPDPARVRFVEFASASLNIEIFAYILAADFQEFVEIKEDILLKMMDVVEESGTGFAFPSQTVYLARDKGLSSEKTVQAEDKVRRRIAEGELPIPRFDPDQIEKMKGSLAYPPEGSVKEKVPENNK